MAIAFYQVDAFTNRMFGGNPAAVVLLNTAMADEWMQHIAAEMNLAETAFLLPNQDGFRLRWFTPEVEVDLCGHATLASAHVLFHQLSGAHTGKIHFDTNSGVLTAQQSGTAIQLNFPAESPEQCAYPANLLSALGIATASYVGRNRFDYLVEVDSEETVRELQPDWTSLKQIDTRGIIVTSRSSDPMFDFVSRAFFPRIGVNEDPVTGSAHCCLAPYWQDKLHKTDFHAYQASARGGELGVSIAGDRVLLSGHAVTVMQGEILDT